MEICPFTADKMWISVLTSSVICLSKVQFHMCSFPRSNCQFLEHRHFTTQEREENNCRFLTLQFAPSWQGQERSCLQMSDFHRRVCVYTRRNLIYGLHFLQHHTYPNLFVAEILVANTSFFSVDFYASAPAECTNAFVRMVFSSQIPFLNFPLCSFFL